MSNVLQVQVKQIGGSASQATARDHTFSIDRPVEKGGENQGPMGGELLLAALGGCFMSNLLAAIKARSSEVSDIDISVEGALESAPPHFGTITMKIRARYQDRAELEKLI